MIWHRNGAGLSKTTPQRRFSSAAGAVNLKEKGLTGVAPCRIGPCRIGPCPRSKEALGPGAAVRGDGIGVSDFRDFLFGVVVQPALIRLHARGRAEPHVPIAAHHNPKRPPAVIAAQGHELRVKAPSAG